MEPEAGVAPVYQPWQGRILTVELLGQRNKWWSLGESNS